MTITYISLVNDLIVYTFFFLYSVIFKKVKTPYLCLQLSQVLTQSHSVKNSEDRKLLTVNLKRKTAINHIRIALIAFL